MDITKYFRADLSLIGMEPADKEEVCKLMVDMLIDKGVISPDRNKILLDKLMEREALSSTGIGNGVAIPHAAGENIEDMIVAIGQIPEGVEFDSIDGEPVRLLFMIIGSDRSARTHLQLLASIVRALKNNQLVDDLLNAKSGEDVYRLIAGFYS